MSALTCKDCANCGPDRGENIRCDAPFWSEIDEPDDSDMREIHPTFAEECADFEALSLPLTPDADPFEGLESAMGDALQKKFTARQQPAPGEG